MGLEKFELGIERLVEGGFARLFKSGLQPVELGRRLTREMDLRRTVGVNGLVSPNLFLIALSKADYERFSQFMNSLERELIESVKEHARTERYSFMGPVRITIELNDRLKKGIFLVNAEIAGPRDGDSMCSLKMPDGRRVDLNKEQITIGRLAECDIPLTDANASRKHARIIQHGNDFFISDLGSTNGTKVNGTWVTDERQLFDGDEIVIGATVIYFEGS